MTDQQPLQKRAQTLGDLMPKHTCPLCLVEGPKPMMMDATRYPCGTMKCLRSGEVTQSQKCKDNIAESKARLATMFDDAYELVHPSESKADTTMNTKFSVTTTVTTILTDLLSIDKSVHRFDALRVLVTPSQRLQIIAGYRNWYSEITEDPYSGMLAGIPVILMPEGSLLDPVIAKVVNVPTKG